nr:ATP-binding protein [Streptomyces corchorusii]
MLATAILDRLLHHCVVITINGPATGSRTASKPSS